MHTPRPDRQRREKTTPHGSRMLLLSHLPQAVRQPSPGGNLAAAAPAPHASTLPEAAAHRGAAGAPATSELAHDARNLFSALHLYCDLLASPGVLAPGFAHYAGDLRVLGASGMRLVEALAGAGSTREVSPPLRRRPFPGIEDLGAELLALEAPLRALAGPAVRLEVECAPCAGRLGLNSEDLLRVLFNLVANSVEAMRTGPSAACRDGLLRITAQRGGAASFLPHSSAPGEETVVLSVRDNGPGIAAADLERIFDPGFSTRERGTAGEERPPREPDGGLGGESTLRSPRGLGLAIVRQLVESAGGTVRAVSPPRLGTRFDIELPVFGGAATPLPEAAGTESGKRAEGSEKRIFEIPAAKRKRSIQC